MNRRWGLLFLSPQVMESTRHADALRQVELIVVVEPDGQDSAVPCSMNVSRRE